MGNIELNKLTFVNSKFQLTVKISHQNSLEWKTINNK